MFNASISAEICTIGDQRCASKGYAHLSIIPSFAQSAGIANAPVTTMLSYGTPLAV